jgi:hypothetical protein
MEKTVEKKWDFLGLQCIVTRNDLGGPSHSWSAHRCGYVRVPAGHPFHGKGYDDIDVNVHGGLTFAEVEPCAHEDGTGYWIGFDFAHGGDTKFADENDPRALHNMFPALHHYPDRYSEHYWTLEEVQKETEDLARQVIAAK